MSDADIRTALDQSEEHTIGENFGSTQRQNLKIGSDVEIAGRIATDFRREFGEVVYADGDFWRYGGTHWQPITHLTVRRAAHLYDGATYETPSQEPADVKLGKARIDSIIHEMGAMLARLDFFAKAPTGINCASGFIRFDTSGQPRISPHDRTQRCRHVLPGRWHSGSAAEEPPSDSLLHQLLDGVFKGDEDSLDKLKLLAEIAGSAALGYGTKLLQPKAVVLKGETAENGKSQILDLIRGLLPPTAIASITPVQMGDERFIVGLRSTLLNATDELSGSAAITSDRFKAVVTGEPVSGRDVYRSAVTFRPVAQHVYATNTLPTFAGGMDRGVQRRLLVVPFRRVIPTEERIEYIGLRIGQEEADLLLAFAVAGAARLIRQRGFTVPPSSKTALQQWLYGADPVQAWVQARVEKADPLPSGQRAVGIKSGDAHYLFRQWALNEGFRDGTIPAVNGFVQRLEANKAIPGITIRHTKSGNWLTGLKILAADRDPEIDNIEEAKPVDAGLSGWHRR